VVVENRKTLVSSFSATLFHNLPNEETDGQQRYPKDKQGKHREHNHLGCADAKHG
jgi:hypothetical protein